MRSILRYGAATAVLLSGVCVHAVEKQAATAPAVTAVKDGDTLTLGERQYVVRVVGGSGQQAWSISRTEDDKLALWHDGKIAVYDPKEARPKEFKCENRLNTLSASRERAVVDVTTKSRDAQPAIIDVATGKTRVTLTEKFDGHRWVFGPGGRTALPLEGYGEYAAADLETGKSIPIALPKLASATDVWSWNGFVMADGKNACILLCSFTGSSRKTYRAIFPLDDPAAATFEENAEGAGDLVKRLEKDNILVREPLVSGRPQMLAVVSTKDWKVKRRVEEMSAEGQSLAGTLSPDGKWSYACDRFKGLRIYDRATEKLVGQAPGRDGWSFNAASLGVTFDDTGALAIVGSPYDGTITILRTKDHTLVGRYAIKEVAPAGAIVLPPEKAGGPYQLVVVHTFLPYE